MSPCSTTEQQVDLEQSQSPRYHSSYHVGNNFLKKFKEMASWTILCLPQIQVIALFRCTSLFLILFNSVALF